MERGWSELEIVFDDQHVGVASIPEEKTKNRVVVHVDAEDLVAVVPVHLQVVIVLVYGDATRILPKHISQFGLHRLRMRSHRNRNRDRQTVDAAHREVQRILLDTRETENGTETVQKGVLSRASQHNEGGVREGIVWQRIWT